MEIFEFLKHFDDPGHCIAIVSCLRVRSLSTNITSTLTLPGIFFPWWFLKKHFINNTFICIFRQALRELKSPTKPSNLDEDASTSKQQPKNSKDKSSDSKSLKKMRLGDGKNPLKRLGGRPKPRQKKLSRDDFFKGKLSNVVFRTFYRSSASCSEV